MKTDRVATLFLNCDLEKGKQVYGTFLGHAFIYFYCALQLLSNIDWKEDTKAIVHYKKKYCPEEKWARFHGYCIYFYIPEQFL